jgi:hypothetical protein
VDGCKPPHVAEKPFADIVALYTKMLKGLPVFENA